MTALARTAIREKGGTSIPHEGELRRFAKRLQKDGGRSPETKISDSCLHALHNRCKYCSCLCHDPQI